MFKNPRHFLKCEICGNIVGVIEASGPKLVCCGREMKELTANTVDAAKEKHVPVAEKEGNVLTVDVGSVPHPMLEEHHISWITVAQGKHTQRAVLDHTGDPKAVFLVEDGEITLYEYCNIHGLWASEFEG